MNVRRVCSLFHIGNSATTHEDNFILKKHCFLTERFRRQIEKNRCLYCVETGRRRKKDLLVAVSDGMGGYEGGEKASQMTVRYLSNHYERIVASACENGHGLIKELNELNREVFSLAKKIKKYRNMGATLCGIILNGDRLLGFNAGDSRLYTFVNGELEQVTSDHTEGERLRQMHLLEEHEIASLPHRKNLYLYIGMSEELVVDLYPLRVESEKMLLLLCSDGLSDVLSATEIENVLRGPGTLRSKGEGLINEAINRNPGCGDNITIIFVEIER